MEEHAEKRDLAQPWWDEADTYLFECPGCGTLHAVPTNERGNPRIQWKWNGDRKRPTFRPSVRYDWDGPGSRNHDEHGATPKRCHFHITDGVIKFCGDCTHDLRGKEADLEEARE